MTVTASNGSVDAEGGSTVSLFVDEISGGPLVDSQEKLTFTGTSLDSWATGVLVKPLVPGQHNLRASFNGDSFLAPSVSNTVQFTIPRAVPEVTISPASGLVTLPAGTSLSVRVGARSPEATCTVPPTGALSLRVNSQQEGAPVPVDSTTHEFSFERLVPGEYQLEVAYSGDSNYEAADVEGPRILVVAIQSKQVTPEPAGTNCPHGGQKLSQGTDSDGNGTLDESEADSVSYVCNGAPGVPGDTATTGSCNTTGTGPAVWMLALAAASVLRRRSHG